MTEAQKRLMRGAQSTKRVLELARELSVSVADVSKKHRADPSLMAIAVMMTGYMLVRFTSQPEQVERRYWEAARLAKEAFDATGDLAEGG